MNKAARAGKGKLDRKLDRAVEVVMEALETRLLRTAFACTGTIQTYTAPATGLYSLSVAGAQGGGYVFLEGGLGAVITGEVTLTAGTVVDVVVGGAGQSGGGGENGQGGGGGSFVYVNGASEPLVVAGGGGGSSSAGFGGYAQLTENGASAAGAGSGAGGTNGAGGGGGTSGYGNGEGGGGGGWLGNGGSSYDGGININDGQGGDGPPTFAGGMGGSGLGAPPDGGFGGGGGGGEYDAGGGGGYSGGGGGGDNPISGSGGGGGSYIDSSITSTTTAVTESGNGAVSIAGVLVVNSQTVAVPYERSEPITLGANEPGATLTYAIASSPADGTLSNFNSTTGVVTYTPGTGFVGTDSFKFTATDGTTTDTGTVTLNVAASTTAPWMSTLSDTLPLSEISLPGTYESEAGPGLQNALYGSGSNAVTITGSTALDNSAVALHLAADAASELANIGSTYVDVNGAAAIANAAALAADVAAGITGQSSGAGLYLGLASDVAGVTSSVVSTAQANDYLIDTTDDTAATTDDAAEKTDSTTSATQHNAAAGANMAAGKSDGTAGTANGTTGAMNGTTGAMNQAASDDDTTSDTLDDTAEGLDESSLDQGGEDPVDDEAAGGASTAAAVEDQTSALEDTDADGDDAADDIEDVATETLDNATKILNMTAEADDAGANGEDAALSTLVQGYFGALNAASTAHTNTGLSDGASAASYGTAAADDAYTAEQYYAFVAGISTPDTTGGNSLNANLQSTLKQYATADASLHTAAATAETAATLADGIAAGLDAAAASADKAAGTAAENEITANGIADDENGDNPNMDAANDDSQAEEENETAATDDGNAVTDNTTAIGLNTTEGANVAAAGIGNGAAAGTNIAAGVADITEEAVDATAAATVEIPGVDIGTGIAAAAATGVAQGLDGADDAANTAAIVVDTTANGPVVPTVAADNTAATTDGMAAKDGATAATGDATAATQDSKAAGLDTEAAEADSEALAAAQAADTANAAADKADAAASKANNVAESAEVAAATADATLTAELEKIEVIQQSLQTQTLPLSSQLNAGIRSVDLQGALVNNTIDINAGQYFTGATLQSAMNDMTSFLQANPSETIVVTLGDQTPAVNSSFNTDLTTLLNSSDTAVPGSDYNQFVYYSPNSAVTPTLGKARGQIVFVPAADGSWSPPAANSNGEIGWNPVQVIQNTPNETDPNIRWNDAEGDNSSGLIPTDIGSGNGALYTNDTLYTNDLSQNDIPAPANDTNPVADAVTPIQLGDQVDTIANTYFGEVKVSRTTGIVGIDDPSQNLITEVENENNLPIIVTSDSDAAGATGTLRDAINEANSDPGFNTIEFAPQLTGTTGNTIIMQSNLPAITNDVVIAGAAAVYTNGYSAFTQTAFGNVGSHTVTETDLPASDSGLGTPTTSTYSSVPLLLNTSGVTVTSVAQPVVDPININYGTKLDNSQLQGSEVTVTNGTIANVPGTFAFTSADGTLLSAGDYTEAVTFTPNNPNLNSSSATVTVDVAKVTPTIPALPPSVSITYGTALASSQLAAFPKPQAAGGALPGTWAYTSAAGTVLYAGGGRSEAITFIPTDSTDYVSVSSSVNVNVAQATPTVTAVNPVNINYGVLLDNSQLSGTASYSVGGTTVNVPGTFTYLTAEGAMLTAGNGQSEKVLFTPADTTDYLTPAPSTVTVNVTGGYTPTIVSVNPVSIPAGTALANSQLSGTATYVLDGNTITLPGTFRYTTAAGTVPSTGNNYSEAVTFTPTDTTDYTTASSTVTVNVGPATPAVVISSPVNITYGTALANIQIIGTATVKTGGTTVNVPGVFSYTSALGNVLGAGNGQTEAVTFTPTDTTDYTSASSTVTVNVAQATPILSYDNPNVPTPATGPLSVLNIQYGTPLTNDAPPPVPPAPASTAVEDNQLNAAVTYTVGGNPVSVPGTFTYTTAAGTVLNPGNGQVEAVTFTPVDTTDFKPVTSTVTVNVAPDVPQVTLTDGSQVATTGTGTSNSVLSYSSPYTGAPQPATGTAAGATGAALGTPVITYYLASDTKLANPLPGAPTAAGNYQVVGTFAAPSPSYIASGDVIDFTITPAAPTVTSVSPVNIPYGTALANSQLSGSANITLGGQTVAVPGTFAYTSAAGTVLHPGNGQSEAVTFTPTSSNYAPVTTAVKVNVAKATVTSVNTVNITYGTALPTGPVSGSATSTVAGVVVSVPGTYTYNTAGGSVLQAGNGQTEAVTFTPADTADYNTVATTVTVNVAQATPTISVTDNGGVYNGSPYTATGTTSNGAPYYEYFLQSDTAFKNPSTTAPTNVGSYVVIGFSPVNSNYVQVGKAVYFSITQAGSVLSPVAAAPVSYGGSTTLSTTLKTSGGAILAGRTVTFSLNGKSVGTAVTNASGVATLSASVAGITPGVYSSGITASFAGDTNSTAASTSGSLTVLDAPIVSKVTASGLVNVGTVSGSFTQARTGAAAGDFVVTVNWGDGSAPQQVQVLADLLHSGQFDLLGASHLYLALFKSYTVTVTISTVGKFGAVAGATTTYTTTITA